jgi:demethylmenaquinone methyltransferase/2-methoxy-6-polyprenyl-1,4-benzoquinol methylase
MPAPSGHDVQALFADIAPRYDRLNRILSLGLDQRWRRRAVASLGLPRGSSVLDLCCGTGDFALACADAGGHQVVGVDFAQPMLRLAADKSQGSPARAAGFVQADAQCLPFADHSFDGLTVAFGLRNVEDPAQALRECRRVLRSGGRLAVIEFFRVPNWAWRSIFRLYFHGIAPLVARVAGTQRPSAYRYLPASVDGFVLPDGFRAWLGQAGFTSVRTNSFSGGVALLLTATAEVAAQRVGNASA